MNKHHRIAHMIAAAGIAAHVGGHLMMEAWHELLLEASIAPVMHFVEHHVGRAEAEAGIIAEAPVDPRIFHAHHREAR